MTGGALVTTNASGVGNGIRRFHQVVSSFLGPTKISHLGQMA